MSMLLDMLGLSQEDVKNIPEIIKKALEDIEIIKLLLQDKLEINKQILAELKKRGKND